MTSSSRCCAIPLPSTEFPRNSAKARLLPEHLAEGYGFRTRLARRGPRHHAVSTQVILGLRKNIAGEAVAVRTGSMGAIRAWRLSKGASHGCQELLLTTVPELCPSGTCLQRPSQNAELGTSSGMRALAGSLACQNFNTRTSRAPGTSQSPPLS